MLGTRQLDSRIATVFRDFSLTHNRQQAYRAIQVQAQALPAVAERLQAMAQYLERMGDSIGEKLTANQALFHQSTEAAYTSLARSVDSSLKESLADSGRVAGESIRPVLADAVSSIGNSMAASAQEMSANAQANSTMMLAEIAALLQSSEQLIQARIASEASWAASRQEHVDRLTETLKTALAELREQEELRQESAVTRLAELESTVANHLTRLGQGLEEPMNRLIQTASETPRAAAEVIGQLRAEIAGTVERDNELLRERQRVMGELNTLSESLQQAATSQREAIENLVDSAATTLQEISSRFGDQVGAQALKIADATTDIAGGAVELSSMGEAFALAVELFSGSNQSMMEHLSRIEEAMERSSDRSDEQMAYYVAQAREIIDQSMVSQREIIEDLQRLGRVQQPVAAGAV
jgi:Sec7-like guanine-nucleotide exchange factor